MTREHVLSILRQRQGQFCSGEWMSRELNISRAAVWKAVDALRRDGYEITSVPHRGYRLDTSPDRLNAGELQEKLTGCSIGRELICLDCVDSTNNYAKKLADDGAAHGTVILAHGQTGGRGRQGKSFSSPDGKGLYLSVLLRPDCPPMDAINLTAWTAVAVCTAIEQVIGRRPGIKWTNDIILDNKKLCGILTEMGLEAESGRLQYIVIGIGLNVSQQENDFAGELTPIATSLQLVTGQIFRRIDLAAAILHSLDDMLRSFPHDKQRYLERYRADCLTIGHEVRLIQKGESRTAFARTIDEDFALVVQWEDGSDEAITAGDVSVRGLLGYI